MILPSGLVIASIAMLTRSVVFERSVKEIKVKLADRISVEGREKEIMLSLIRQYNIAQDDIISKYQHRLKNFERSILLLIASLCALFAFIIGVLLSKVIWT